MRGLLAIVAALAPVATSAQLVLPEFGGTIMECAFDRYCGSSGECDTSQFIVNIMRSQDGTPVTDSLLRIPLQEIAGDDAVSYVGVQRNGSIFATTRFSDGTAVHSRHTYLLKGIGSQYHGTCVLMENE